MADFEIQHETPEARKARVRAEEAAKVAKARARIAELRGGA